MNEEAESVNEAGGDPGESKSRDVVEILSGVPSAQCLHSYVADFDVQTVRNAQRQIFENLLL